MLSIIRTILGVLISLWICIMVISYQEYAQKGTMWWIGFWVVFWLSIALREMI